MREKFKLVRAKAKTSWDRIRARVSTSRGDERPHPDQPTVDAASRQDHIQGPTAAIPPSPAPCVPLTPVLNSEPTATETPTPFSTATSTTAHDLADLISSSAFLGVSTSATPASIPAPATASTMTPAQAPDSSPAVPSEAQFTSLWCKVVEEKKKQDTKANLSAILSALDPSPDGIKVLIKEANDLVTKVEDNFNKTWVIYTGSERSVVIKNQSLKDFGIRIVSFLRCFEKVGDVVAGVDPLHFGPAWVVVKFLLTAGTAAGSSRENALALIALAGPLLVRCVVNEHLYLTENLALEPSGEQDIAALFSDLRRIITNIYSDVIDILRYSVHLLQANIYKQAAKAIFGPQQPDKFVITLSQHDYQMNTLVESLFKQETL